MEIMNPPETIFAPFKGLYDLSPSHTGWIGYAESMFLKPSEATLHKVIQACLRILPKAYPTSGKLGEVWPEVKYYHTVKQLLEDNIFYKRRICICKPETDRAIADLEERIFLIASFIKERQGGQEQLFIDQDRYQRLTSSSITSFFANLTGGEENDNRLVRFYKSFEPEEEFKIKAAAKGTMNARRAALFLNEKQHPKKLFLFFLALESRVRIEYLLQSETEEQQRLIESLRTSKNREWVELLGNIPNILNQLRIQQCLHLVNKIAAAAVPESAKGVDPSPNNLSYEIFCLRGAEILVNLLEKSGKEDPRLTTLKELVNRAKRDEEIFAKTELREFTIKSDWAIVKDLACVSITLSNLHPLFCKKMVEWDPLFADHFVKRIEREADEDYFQPAKEIQNEQIDILKRYITLQEIDEEGRVKILQEWREKKDESLKMEKDLQSFKSFLPTAYTFCRSLEFEDSGLTLRAFREIEKSVERELKSFYKNISLEKMEVRESEEVEIKDYWSALERIFLTNKTVFNSSSLLNSKNASELIRHVVCNRAEFAEEIAKRAIVSIEKLQAEDRSLVEEQNKIREQYILHQPIEDLQRRWHSTVSERSAVNGKLTLLHLIAYSVAEISVEQPDLFKKDSLKQLKSVEQELRFELEPVFNSLSADFFSVPEELLNAGLLRDLSETQFKLLTSAQLFTCASLYLNSLGIIKFSDFETALDIDVDSDENCKKTLLEFIEKIQKRGQKWLAPSTEQIQAFAVTIEAERPLGIYF